MDLAEFVKTSLVQIVKGVSDTMLSTQDQVSRAVVNPTLPHAAHAEPTEINFDIAVTVQEDTDIKGGSSIQVFGAKFGVDANKGASNTAVNGITFSVPVSLPSVAKDQYPSSGRGTVHHDDSRY